MALVKVRFLSGIANEGWAFDPGQIVEMPEENARDYIGMGIAVELSPQVCPHCHKAIGEGVMEAATMAHSPRRRG